MSKPKCGFIRLLLGTSAAITVRDESPLAKSKGKDPLLFSSDTEPVQSLLLRRFGIKSRTKTQHILTANHHGDADIFLKKQNDYFLQQREGRQRQRERDKASVVVTRLCRLSL